MNTDVIKNHDTLVKVLNDKYNEQNTATDELRQQFQDLVDTQKVHLNYIENCKKDIQKCLEQLQKASDSHDRFESLESQILDL